MVVDGTHTLSCDLGWTQALVMGGHGLQVVGYTFFVMGVTADSTPCFSDLVWRSPKLGTSGLDVTRSYCLQSVGHCLVVGRALSCNGVGHIVL